MDSKNNTIIITEKIRKMAKKATKIAVDYEKLTKRKLGITGEIGEVFVCDRLKLKLLSDPLSAGYDAIDNRGNSYQIKSRRVEGHRGKISSFSKHKFDYAILAILKPNYKIHELRKASYKNLKPILDRLPKRNPSFTVFCNISKKINL